MDLAVDPAARPASIAPMQPPAPLAISARGLRGASATVRAVTGIDLEVRAGHDLRHARAERGRQDDADADAGDAAAAGRGRGDGDGARPRRGAATRCAASIAMTGQFASLDEDLTGRENLLLLARLWGFRWRAARGRGPTSCWRPSTSATRRRGR